MELLWTLSLFFLGVYSDNLKVVYQWKELDFEYPSHEDFLNAVVAGDFIPENNLPLGLEVHNNRLFVTVPRWRSGVAASLTYINLSEPLESPKLKPYPNWDAHRFLSNDSSKIISPFRIRADKCDRLWVLDTGVDDILGEPKVIASTRLLVYDLKTDELLLSYELPKDQVSGTSFFANIAVEDHDCNDSYAYLGDLGKPGIVVYSFKNRESWRVVHHFFNIDPLAGEFNISGIVFEWTDGIFGLALSKPDTEGYSTLSFHPLTSTEEFSVNTKYLRNKTLSKTSFHEFKHLGSRGPKGQSGPSFLDQKSDVLFYALVNLNAVACWRTTNPEYTMLSQGRIIKNNITMVFPNDIKVDANDNLWVLSDRLPQFMYSTLDKNEINFRILMGSVADVIRGTACDSKLVIPPDVMEKFKPAVKNKENKNSVSRVYSSFTLLCIVFVAILRL